MPMILVADEEDHVANTAFINTLHDVDCRRAVLHVPQGTSAFYDELLTTLGRERVDDASNPKARRVFAEAWLVAYQPFDLFVYGAWRLHDRETWWLHALGQSPGLRLWLITHTGATNMPRLRTAAGPETTLSEFRRVWKSPPGRSLPTAERPALRTFAQRPPASESAMLPWPWGLVDALTASDENHADGFWAADLAIRNRVATCSSNLELSVAIREIFASWNTRQAREFALNSIREHTFHGGYWFDWVDDLPTVEVRLPRAWPRTRPECPQEPTLAAHVAIKRAIPPDIDVDVRDVEFAPSGRSFLLPGGTMVDVEPADQPAVRGTYISWRARTPTPTVQHSNGPGGRGRSSWRGSSKTNESGTSPRSARSPARSKSVG